MSDRQDRQTLTALPQHLRRTLWLLTCIALAVVVILPAVQITVNLDGAIYASIARNLAEGVGSVWKPYFSKALFPEFHEHLPFMMLLESFAFRLFGDSILVEKGFSLFVMFCVAFVWWRLWNRLNADDPEYILAAPLAFLMALIAGRVGWAFANGMLENLVILLTSLGVLLVVETYADERRSSPRRIAAMMLVGLLVLCAFLTKVTGLFVLGAPGLYWLAFQRPRFLVAVVDTLVVVATFAFGVFLLWQFDGPRNSISVFLQNQLFASLSGQRGGTGGLSISLGTFFRANMFPLLAAGLVATGGLLVRARAPASSLFERERWRRFAFLFLVGCSASLPILVSKRVYVFYFNPSVMYFSAACAVLIVPSLVATARCVSGLGQRVTHALLALALAGVLVLVAFNVGKLGSDAGRIDAVEKIKAYACARSADCRDAVAACEAAWVEWELHAYLERYYKMSLGRLSTGDAREFVVADETCLPNLKGYSNTGVDLWRFRLMERRKTPAN